MSRRARARGRVWIPATLALACGPQAIVSGTPATSGARSSGGGAGAPGFDDGREAGDWGDRGVTWADDGVQRFDVQGFDDGADGLDSFDDGYEDGFEVGGVGEGFEEGFEEGFDDGIECDEDSNDVECLTQCSSFSDCLSDRYCGDPPTPEDAFTWYCFLPPPVPQCIAPPFGDTADTQVVRPSLEQMHVAVGIDTLGRGLDDLVLGSLNEPRLRVRLGPDLSHASTLFTLDDVPRGAFPLDLDGDGADELAVGTNSAFATLYSRTGSAWAGGDRMAMMSAIYAVEGALRVDGDIVGLVTAAPATAYREGWHHERKPDGTFLPNPREMEFDWMQGAWGLGDPNGDGTTEVILRDNRQLRAWANDLEVGLAFRDGTEPGPADALTLLDANHDTRDDVILANLRPSFTLLRTHMTLQNPTPSEWFNRRWAWSVPTPANLVHTVRRGGPAVIFASQTGNAIYAIAFEGLGNDAQPCMQELDEVGVVHNATSGDFNGDGLIDLAVVGSTRVRVFPGLP